MPLIVFVIQDLMLTEKLWYEDIDLHWRINLYLFSDLMLEICQAKHLIFKKKNELDFPLIADQRSREMVFHIMVCSYKKLADFTTNGDANH